MIGESLVCSQCGLDIPIGERAILRTPSPFGYLAAWIHGRCKPLRVSIPKP